jgi:hypothetical protein
MGVFFIGLFTIIIGVMLMFSGYQLFRVLIPVWGLFVGFIWTAQIIAVGLGTGFLTTVTSWVVGILVGVIFAIFAYMFYEIAVGVLIGFLGYWVVGSFMMLSGVAQGVFVTSVASIAGVIFGASAVYMHAPKGLLIVLTALAGATTAIAGFLVLFGQLPVDILGSGLISTIISYSFGWTFVWIALVIVGVIAQLQILNTMTSEYSGYQRRITYTGAKGGKISRRFHSH